MEPVAQGLYTAMREWNGVKLASEVRVLDALRDVPERSLEEMQSVAREVRAGKLVWGRVLVKRDTVTLRVGLYDALDGTTVRERTLTGSRRDLLQQAGGLDGLVADLLRVNPVTPLDAHAEVGTRSLAAWRSYDEARRALEEWRVPAALAALRRAVEADPNFGPAQVWLAQVLLWRGAPAQEWGGHVDIALRHRGALSRREFQLADALHALDKGRAKESCEAFASLRGADSLDAVAWLGLAYCEGLNQRVVRDQRSPTGWAFEGNENAAQFAYTQAVRIAPASFRAFSFENVVKRLFVVERSKVRPGIGPDSALFFSIPDLVGDSLTTVAHPYAELHLRPLRALAPRNDQALTRNRERLLALLATLTQYRPDDPDAFEALALVLELRDEITGTPNGGYSALSALERAKLLATDTTQRARLGAFDVRLHLKLADFSRAASLGDSILAASPRASGRRAEALIGVAALLGREADAVRLIRASGTSVSIGSTTEAPLIADVATALFMRTALGVCDDSVRTLQRRLDTLLESYVGPAQRTQVRDHLLERPLTFAVGCLGPAALLALNEPQTTGSLVFQLLARGDTASARTRLDSVQRGRSSLRGGELSLDRTLAEAWTRVALRDTAAAVRQLDLTLTALPTLSSFVVYEPGMAASIGRTMAYRAELASRAGDRGTAALWAGRVLTLWSHADPSVASTLVRMRQLVRQSQ